MASSRHTTCGLLLVTSLVTLLLSKVTAEYLSDLHIEESLREKRDTSSGGQELVKRLLVNYDHTLSPGRGLGNGEATEVKVGFYIVSANLKNSDIEASIYFRQCWTDKRLQFQPQSGMKEHVVRINTEELLDKIWTPDTFFRYATAIRDHKLPSKNILFRVKHDGGVWYVQKLTIKMPCQPTKRYPVDVRKCKFQVESFGYTTEDLIIKPFPFPMHSEVSGFEGSGWFETGKEVEDCSENYTTGVYPCLSLSIDFRRAIGYHLLKVYVPSALLVMLSWLSLWMDPKHKMIARLVPGIAAQLGLIFLGSTAYDEMSKIYVITPMHIWMGFSHLMVFLTLVKLVVLEKILEGQGQATSQPKHETDNEGGQGGVERKKSGRIAQILGRIEFISKVAFPGVYILFNIIYWIAC